MSWEAALEQSLGNSRHGSFGHIVHFVQGPANNKKDTNGPPKQSPGEGRNTETRISTSVDNMDRMDKIPPLNAHECQEVTNWPVQTQRVFTRLLDHFEARGFPLIQAERLAFTTLMVLKKRKGWPLILVHDLPPEIGRAVGLVLDAFPGTKLMNYGHKTGTAQ